jgi:hypothetical protein
LPQFKRATNGGTTEGASVRLHANLRTDQLNI